LKSVRIHEQGGSEALRFEDSPEPELAGSHDAIVKLAAAAEQWLERGGQFGKIVLTIDGQD